MTARRDRPQPPRSRTRVIVVAAGLLLAACTASGAQDAASTSDAAGSQEADPARPRGAVAEPEESDDGSSQAALEALRDGGQVVYLRHAATEEFNEGADVDLDDPATQRNLSAEGRRQAEAIGRGFERLDLPVGSVVSSPYWRARETAQLAFGTDAISIEHDLLYDEHPDVDRSHLADVVRRKLAERPADGTNTVIVGHGGNLQGATRVTIDEGAAAVFTPTGEGADLVGVLPAHVWDTLEAPD